MKHLRAILILLHLFAINIIAFPTPRGSLSKKHVQKPDVQESIALWHKLLFYDKLTGRSVKQFSDDLVSIGRWLVTTQKNVTKPFAPYYKYAGTRQSWQMFGYVQHTAGLLNILIQDNNGWTPLYIGLHPEHQWKHTLINQERVRATRSLFAQKRYLKRYDLFAQWIADKAFDEFPSSKAVRIFYQQRTIPKPSKFEKHGPQMGDIFWERTIVREP